MHYTDKVQIEQEKQIAGMMRATNALQIEAQIRNEQPPKIASAMAMNLRDIVMSLPSYRRAEQNTFPGSKPNPVNPTRVSSFEESASLAQRPVYREIPATGAGHISEEAA
jgi:hypothetical protein